MTLDDWILALHVLSAFALVAAVVVFWVLVAAARGEDADVVSERLGPVGGIGTAAVAIGSAGTLVFGVWLALSVGGYDLWDGWILAAFVLWAIGVETGRRSGEAFGHGDRRRGVLMHTISSVAVLLILIDMFWKPGA